MPAASFPNTLRPFEKKALTINTSGGGSADPFPIVDVSQFANKPFQLKKVEKAIIKFASPVTLGPAPLANIVLSYFAADGTTKIEITRILAGTNITDLVITPPNTGPLLGSGEFPILEANGVGLDAVVIDLAQVFLSLDR